MITKRQFNTFEDIFNYYNEELFSGSLPEVMINMSRKKNSHGFFAPMRWKGTADGKHVHEISLNPDSLKRTAIEWHSTLVHEMCHLWRQELKDSRAVGYHCRKWGNKMEEIGLMPSNTGLPGGRKTGVKMTHYIIEGGKYQEAFNRIQGEDFSDMILPYLPAGPLLTKSGKPIRSQTKIKYECSCGFKVWGKPDLKLSCDQCGERFESQ